MPSQAIAHALGKLEPATERLLGTTGFENLTSKSARALNNEPCDSISNSDPHRALWQWHICEHLRTLWHWHLLVGFGFLRLRVRQLGLLLQSFHRFCDSDASTAAAGSPATLRAESPSPSPRNTLLVA
jgi:hypothetical protein